MEKEKGRPISLAAALRRQHTNHKKYDSLPTGQDGTLLRVEAGASPNLSPKELGMLVVAATAYKTGKVFRDKIAGIQQKRHRTIENIAASHDGVRGVVFMAAGKVLNIIPKYTIEWNQPGLKTALGENYPAVVSEYIHLSAILPQGAQLSDGTTLTPEKARMATILGLVAFGLNQEGIENAVTAHHGFTVADGLLNTMAQDGRVPDIEKAGIATKTLAITLDPFKG